MSQPKDCVLIMFGSFNPPTNGHAHLLAMAKAKIEENGYHVRKGFFVPTNGKYFNKHSLAADEKRVHMCRLYSIDNDWIDVEPFETEQKDWTRCAVTLQHVQEKSPDCRVFVVCGIDYVQRWNEPCWDEADCLKILKDYGIIVARRQETLENLVSQVKYLQGEGRLDNVYMLDQNVLSEVSSTVVRDLYTHGKYVVGLVPHEVDKYIRENNLYPEQK